MTLTPQQIADGWKPLVEAKYNTSYRLLLEDGSEIIARLIPDFSMDENEVACDQWVADTADYPPCWTAGECWASNEHGDASLQPIAYREAP